MKKLEPKGEFEPCYVVNDWMVLGYFIGHNHQCTKWGTHSLRDQVDYNVKGGEIVEVLFPDGTTEELQIIPQDVTNTYSDHGHSHSVRTKKFYVEKTVNGVVVRIPIDELFFKLPKEDNKDA